jgi:hypothetical protein
MFAATDERRLNKRRFKEQKEQAWQAGRYSEIT